MLYLNRVKSIFTFLILSILSLAANAKTPTCDQLHAFVDMARTYHFSKPKLNEDFVANAGISYLRILDSGMIYLTQPEFDKLSNKIKKNKSKYFKNYKEKKCLLFVDLEKEVIKGEKRLFKIIKEGLKEEPKAIKLKYYKDRFKSVEELNRFVKNDIQNQMYLQKNNLAALKLSLTNKESVFKNYKEKRTLYLLKSFYKSLDPHSDYISEKESNAFENGMKGNIIGIGIVYAADLTGLRIDDVVKNSPAAKTEILEVGDYIIEYNGKKVNITNVKEFYDEVDGTVKKMEFLVLKKNKEKKLMKLTTGLIREEETHVSSEIKKVNDKTILVLKIPSFYHNPDDGSGSTSDMMAAYEKNIESKPDLIILDLRNNAGGRVDEAVSMVGAFVGRNVVLYTKQEYGIFPSPYYGVSRVIAEPLVILTNKGSASASEIVAGALKDFNRGIIIGDKTTYGKGTVQSIINNPRSEELGMIKITMAKFYLPRGDSTQIKGVKSDIVLDNKFFKDSHYTLEKDQPNPLNWDSIPTPYKFLPNDRKSLEEIAKLSSERTKKIVIKDNKDKKDYILEEALNISNDYLTKLSGTIINDIPY